MEGSNLASLFDICVSSDLGMIVKTGEAEETPNGGLGLKPVLE